MGENRGALARHVYDVWTYQGEAGEVLSLQMRADHPITRSMAFEERFAAGVLDTVLTVYAPDGTLLTLNDDAIAKEGWNWGDSAIDAVALPVDGEYRIEAQSYLDDLAGGYTLVVDSWRPEIDPATLQSYVGDYTIPAFPAEVSIFLEEGRLIMDWWPDVMPLSPLNATEFRLQPWGFPLVFRTGEAGQVTGFDFWMFGGWVEAYRMEE